MLPAETDQALDSRSSGRSYGSLDRAGWRDGRVRLVEGLDLAAAAAGWHDLICPPLRLVGRDGSPARALVRPHIS